LALRKIFKEKPARRLTVRKWKYSHLKNIEDCTDKEEITTIELHTINPYECLKTNTSSI